MSKSTLYENAILVISNWLTWLQTQHYKRVAKGGLRLSLHSESQQVGPKAQWTIPVTLYNHSQFSLKSFPDHLLHLSFHWLEQKTGTIYLHDGPRFVINELESGCEQTIDLTILSPSEPGNFILRITLVAEGICWFDESPIGFYADLPIHVTSGNVFIDRPEISPERFHKTFSHNGFSRPIMIVCETVNACNLSCIICAYSVMERAKKLMDMATFKRVLDCYSEIGGGTLSLTPTVGDIFLDKRLIERLRLLEQYPDITLVSVTTNAVLANHFNDEELAYILKRLSRVDISVYGLDREEYQEMSRRDCFDEMVTSVKRIVRLIDDPDKLRMGFRLLKKRSDETINRWIIDNFGIEILFGSCWEYMNWSILDTSKPLPHDANWLPAKTNSGQCLIPAVALQVFSNGNVSFCHCDDFDNNEDLSLGNINQNNFIELYNSEKVKKLYQFEQHIPQYCKNCSFHQPLSNLENMPWIYEHPVNFIGG